ncbi:MAG: pentapeptide repeat-containing protein [Calditrichia bacterium]
MSYHKCAEEGCPFKPISFTHYCWQHIPDKKNYVKKLRQNIESSVAPVTLDKIVLDNHDLSGLDLRSASIVGAMLLNVDFSNSNMTNINLKRSFIHKSKFQNTKLIQATLSGTIVLESEFKDVDMSLVEGNLLKTQNCKFNNLYVKSADLKNTFWKDDIFEAVHIADSNFMMSFFDAIKVQNSKLDNALFSGSQFYKCQFSRNELIEVNYIGCLIENNQYKDSPLQNCRFATAILHNTTYQNCVISKPIMRETQIVSTRFIKCEITNPVLQRAIIIQSNLNPQKLSNANTEGIVVM